MKAYEIANGMVDTMDLYLESEQTELDQENHQEIMEFLKGELEKKSSSILRYLRNLDLETEILKNEIERLEANRKAKERKAKNLKNYLVGIMRTLDKSKVDMDIGSFGIRKSQAVSIIDENLIPKKYISKRVELSVDKRAIGMILKSGKKIKGAEMVENYSLQVK